MFPIGSPLLSSTWFPSSERATATAIGAGIAPQVGVLIAMGITPVVIHSPLTEQVCNSSNTSPTVSSEEVRSWSDEVYYRWLYYQCAVAGVAILSFLLTVCGEWMMQGWLGQGGYNYVGWAGYVRQEWLWGRGAEGLATWGIYVGHVLTMWGRDGYVGQGSDWGREWRAVFVTILVILRFSIPQCPSHSA